MHGLINRAIQSFVCATYGRPCWLRATQTVGLGFSEFEPMLLYDVNTSGRILDALCADLKRPRAEFLEDLGTYLVSHPNTEDLRRLLRFGGVTYIEFLHSLDDLSDRVRLAVSDLKLPALELTENAPGDFTLHCFPGLPGYSSVMTGVLRAMADDYGALVMLSHDGCQGEVEVISITLVESAFAAGRRFELGARKP
ncbi:heme NO-binding domain-containing protein [Ruegeria sp.]|uniref:heme NO-binding domain-containing protein n=1 Tax=Ruegeria sp. TaxID=1879320 RepID=UPI002323DE4C|nr:heme NO-binding domain-containing protein [Ruegeria sp.]MDA7963041.1 heme NO-binding domain-containing protein [Ruegeria sp.]